MGAAPAYYTGEDATIALGTAGAAGSGQSTFAVSDFSMTISKGTAEQELVGSKGSYFLAGSRSVETSLTACKLTTAGLAWVVGRMIDGSPITVSGNSGTNSLHFYFKSCQVTGFDFSVGTADEITEGSVDFAILYPYKVSSVYWKSGQDGVWISDFTPSEWTGSGSITTRWWRGGVL